MSAQQQNFEKAANLFEEVSHFIVLFVIIIIIIIIYQIGKGCLDNNLLKYSAKDYFFKALVCWFCKDKEIVTVNQCVVIQTYLWNCVVSLCGGDQFPHTSLWQHCRAGNSTCPLANFWPFCPFVCQNSLWPDIMFQAILFLAFSVNKCIY